MIRENNVVVSRNDDCRQGRCSVTAMSPDPAGMSHPRRIARYVALSSTLVRHSDRTLTELLDQAPVASSGIGGTAVLLELDGIPVFVKRVPLTDLERQPMNRLSTLNLFQLPTFCQYGVGSAGGGVWRELAAHVMTTNWVLANQSQCFPLMYHWRALEGPPPGLQTAEDVAELARMVEYWDNSPAVRHRLEAIAAASATVAVFLEYIPQNLIGWLRTQVARGDDAVESACAMVERNVRAGTSFMNSNGLLHFDAHFNNILTDGRGLYFTDFGLAMSRLFELSECEVDFYERNISHDGCYSVTQLVNWLVTALTAPTDTLTRNEYIRWCAAGGFPRNVVPAAAAVIQRYAPIAVVMNEFYWRLFGESRKTEYPAGEIQRVCASTGFNPILRSFSRI